MLKSSVPRLLVCALVILVPGSGPAGAQGPTGSISGRVTQGGNPASGITLLLTRVLSDERAMHAVLEGSPIVKSVTDEDGRYRFTGVEAGRYEVSPFSPPSVVRSTKNYVTLADGESAEAFDFDLSPGAVITGTVTTPDGRPVIGETISVFPATQPDSAKLRNPDSETCITDDRGIYRVYGLDPGRYLVGVGEENPSASPFTLTTKHPPTFYPGVTAREKAGVVEVAAGAEASRIDIRVGQPSQTFQATGRVLDDAGKPVANLLVTCFSTSADNGSVTPFMSTPHTNSKGEFKVEGLAPGGYSASGNFLYEPDNQLYSETTRFEVKNSDVSGIEIKVHKGLTITGVAAVEGTDDPVILERLTQLELWATIASREQSGFNMSRSKIMPDYSFRLGGLHPGRVHIVLNTLTQATPFSILRIEQNGAPVRDGIEIGAGDQISGIRVVLGYGNCAIWGQISVQGGVLPKDAALEVFAVPSGAGEENPLSALGSLGFAGTHSSAVDSNGRFRMEGLIPGQYEVTVTGPGNGGTPPHYPSAKQTVTLTSGSEVEVNLLLDISKST